MFDGKSRHSCGRVLLIINKKSRALAGEAVTVNCVQKDSKGAPWEEALTITIERSAASEQRFESGLHVCRNALEDPWEEAREDMYTRSVSPEQAPDKPTYLDLEFEGGNPVAIDGQKLSPASLLTQLNKVLHLTPTIIY